MVVDTKRARGAVLAGLLRDLADLFSPPPAAPEEPAMPWPCTCGRNEKCSRCASPAVPGEGEGPDGQEVTRLFRQPEAAYARAAAFESVIRWMMGESGNFPIRPEGAGAYWWRSELRARYQKARQAAPSAPPAEEPPPTRACPACQGTGDGQIEDDDCHRCGGSGEAAEEPPAGEPETDDELRNYVTCQACSRAADNPVEHMPPECAAEPPEQEGGERERFYATAENVYWPDGMQAWKAADIYQAAALVALLNTVLFSRSRPSAPPEGRATGEAGDPATLTERLWRVYHYAGNLECAIRWALGENGDSRLREAAARLTHFAIRLADEAGSAVLVMRGDPKYAAVAGVLDEAVSGLRSALDASELAPEMSEEVEGAIELLVERYRKNDGAFIAHLTPPSRVNAASPDTVALYAAWDTLAALVDRKAGQKGGEG